MPLQHLHRAAYAEILPPGSYDHGFAILRDPKARLISEFRMRAEPLSAKLRPLGWLRLARNRAAGRPTYGLRVGRRLELMDFDHWAARSFAELGRDPMFQSNHMRPQADFVDPAHRLFRFEDGLDPVFRWIDAVTGTPPLSGTFHERRSDPIAVSCSAATEARIREILPRRLRAACGPGRRMNDMTASAEREIDVTQVAARRPDLLSRTSRPSRTARFATSRSGEDGAVRWVSVHE